MPRQVRIQYPGTIYHVIDGVGSDRTVEMPIDLYGSFDIQLDLWTGGLGVVHEFVEVRPGALGFSQVQPLGDLLHR